MYFLFFIKTTWMAEWLKQNPITKVVAGDSLGNQDQMKTQTKNLRHLSHYSHIFAMFLIVFKPKSG